jgi:transposase InsO family protein
MEKMFLTSGLLQRGAVDAFRDFGRFYALKKATTGSVIRCLMKFFNDHGRATAVLNDQGTQFTAKTWKNTLENFNVRCIFTSVRHPQTNPVERVMRELSRLCRAYSHENHKSWIIECGRI